MRKLEDYLQLVRKPNKDLITDTLVGVDINKTLINKEKGKKVDPRLLQIVEKGFFVMSGMSTGRDKRISVALYMGNKPICTSRSGRYYVFKVNNPDLKAEYLNLLFKSEKMDKAGVYFSGTGCRGDLEWKKFIQIPIYTPHLKLQENIVCKYQTVTKYIEVKKKINELLERQMTAYFHLLFDNLANCQTKSFGELFRVIRGERPPRSNKYLEKLYFCEEAGIPFLQVRDVTKQDFKFISETREQLTPEGFKKGNCSIVSPNDLIFIQNASIKRIGKIYVCSEYLTINSNFLAFSSQGANLQLPITFIYFLIRENIWALHRLINMSTATKAFDLRRFKAFKVKIPKNKELINKFNNFCEPIFGLQKNNEQIIQKLLRLQKCWVESLD